MQTRPTKVLLTGDYWHSDFRTLLPNMNCELTLVPREKLTGEHFVNSDFDLIVLAASRRNQFSHEWVESIRCMASPTPTVALLGTWCEGEQRSGEPWPGVKPVYWHQWQDRFDNFIHQSSQDKICDWQLPATSNHADSVLNQCSSETTKTFNRRQIVGVSAVSDMSYQMIADAAKTVATKSYWFEHQNLKPSIIEQLTVVVMDADSWSQDVEDRIRNLRNNLKNGTPIVLLLNFPRQSDMAGLNAIGIFEMVSKPFQLSDFIIAIERATESIDHSSAA